MDTELEKDGLQQVIQRAHLIASQQTAPDDDDDDDDDDNEDGALSKSKLVETKKELDLILTYLRYVHMVCYYCALECDSIEELNRRCLDPHTRKVATGISDSKQAAKNERMGKWVSGMNRMFILIPFFDVIRATMDEESGPTHRTEDQSS
jgi:hypothetical protein